MKFPYRSKFERHLQSRNHQRFARSLAQAADAPNECQSDGNDDMDCDRFSAFFSPNSMPSSLEPNYDNSCIEEVNSQCASQFVSLVIIHIDVGFLYIQWNLS